MCILMTAQRRPYALWLERKFLSWQMDHGRKSIAEFADFLGFSRPTVVHWLNDQRLPSAENADQIASKLGFDVSGHALLGFAEPDPDLLKLKFYWPQMSRQQRAEAKKLINEIEQRHEAIPESESTTSKPKPVAAKRRTAES